LLTLTLELDLTVALLLLHDLLGVALVLLELLFALLPPKVILTPLLIWTMRIIFVVSLLVRRMIRQDPANLGQVLVLVAVGVANVRVRAVALISLVRGRSSSPFLHMPSLHPITLLLFLLLQRMILFWYASQSLEMALSGKLCSMIFFLFLETSAILFLFLETLATLLLFPSLTLFISRATELLVTLARLCWTALGELRDGTLVVCEGCVRRCAVDGCDRVQQSLESRQLSG
jgi:hypothetical protein